MGGCDIIHCILYSIEYLQQGAVVSICCNGVMKTHGHSTRSMTIRRLFSSAREPLQSGDAVSKEPSKAMEVVRSAFLGPIKTRMTDDNHYPRLQKPPLPSPLSPSHSRPIFVTENSTKTSSELCT